MERSVCAIDRAASAMAKASRASVLASRDRGRRSAASDLSDRRPGNPCRGTPRWAGRRWRPVGRRPRARCRAWPATSRRPRGVWARCRAAACRSFLPGRGDGGGVVFALADVQAEEDADVAGVDHVQSPVVLARPSSGTDRHIHITKSLPASGEAGGHAPNQRSVDASGAGDTTPRAMRSTGGPVMPAPEAGSPIAGPRRR